jgi:hypothetical protein
MAKSAGAVRKAGRSWVKEQAAAQLALAVLSVPSVDVRKVLHLLHALWLELEGRRLTWPNDGAPERFSALKRHTVA